MVKIPEQKEPYNQNQEENEESSSGNVLDELEQFNTPAKNVKKENKPKKEESLEQDAPSPWDREDSTPVREFVMPQESVQQYYPMQESPTEQIQEIAEAIIEEKWQEFMSQMGDFDIWRDRVNREIGSVKQELIRTQDRFNNLQKAVLGKVTEYNENILNIGTEMKALEKVFEKILDPLTANIKELDRITKRLKK